MTSSHIALRELQCDMQRHLLGEDSRIAAAIVDAPPLPAAERLAIYRNAYQVRLIDAMNEIYPVLHGLLGDEAWVELGEAYVAQHPSVFRSIRWYGGELADHLASCAPFSEIPILSEVARLEWTLAEVFDATDAVPLPRSALSALDPSDWSTMRLEFHPSLRRLTFSWNTAAVWKAMSQDQTPAPPEMAATPMPWLLWRQSLQNYFRSMDAVESTALAAALRGRNFAQLCAELQALLPAEEIPAAAARLLGTWADSGILVKADSSERGSSQ